MSPAMILFTLTLGQCAGGTCRPGGVEWRARDDERARVYLFVDGRQRGGYDGARDAWRDFDPDRGTWGEARPLFPRRSGGNTSETNFGVMRDRLSSGERMWFGGVPEDSTTPHLTVIGTPAQRQPVLDDLTQHPALSPFRGRLRVQAYDPGHWAVAEAGFVRTGTPTIYLQGPDGRVQHRQDEYHGPDRLAAALRRADPAYRAEADPNLDSPRLTARMPTWGWAGLALASLVLFTRRRNSP